MRGWFLGTACAALALAEVAFGPLLATGRGAGPDLLLPLVVYVALVAPRTVSPFLYLALGMLSDLLAVPHPGLRGFMYVAVGMAVEHVNPGRWRRSPLAQGVLAAAGSFGVEAVYFLVAARDWPGGAYGAARVALLSAAATGLAALALGPPLNALSRVFNWPSSGAPISWAQLVAAAGAGALRAPRRGRPPP